MTKDKQEAVKRVKEARERSRQCQGSLQLAERKAALVAKRTSMNIKLATRDLEAFRKRCKCDKEGGENRRFRT